MRNIVGHPARGTDFYPRPSEIKKIKRSLTAGNHLQIAAPRRVGKTSILMYFIDNTQKEFDFVYVDVEATKSENDFYKRIYESILRSESITKTGRFIKQLKTSGNAFLKRIKSINIADGTIELIPHADTVYYDELNNLLKGLDFGQKRLVLLIDEFPYAINNLIVAHDSLQAKALLKSKRSLRQDPSLSQKIQFVYTGSISLNATVEKIGASELVNDIDSISISTLTIEEGKELILKLISNENIQFTDEHLSYITRKMGWIIPFHIQLFVKEIFDIMDSSMHEPISLTLIDNAFNEIVEFRNNNYFEHYLSRLKQLFKSFDYDFCISVLNTIAENGEIGKKELINFAAKYNLETEYSKIIQSLVYDGYIHSDPTGKVFRFNSSILKMWWQKHAS